MPSIDPKLQRPSPSRAIATVTYTEEEYAPAEKKALERLAQTVNLKGFRPGKAPVETVKEKVNQEQLFEEVIRELLRTTLPQLIEQHQLRPLLPPKVEAVSRTPLTLTITVVEYPEVTVKGGDKLTVEKKEVKVDEKDVQRVIDSVLSEQRAFAPKDKPAAKGDRIIIDFHAKDEAGNDIQELHAHGYDVIIGEANLLPGFEDELMGLSANGEKSFTLTLPEKYANEQLRGKPVTFSVKATRIEEVSTPELTDAFAKEKLNAESAEGFKKMVEASIRSQEEQFVNMQRERELMDTITKNTEVDLAPELVEEEMRLFLADWQDRLSQQGLTLQQWMEREKKDAKALEEDIRKQATDRTKLRFGISKLIEERKITVSPEELEDAKQDFLSQVSDEDRAEAERSLQPGSSSYQELHWRKSVEKLMEQLLG